MNMKKMRKKARASIQAALKEKGIALPAKFLQHDKEMEERVAILIEHFRDEKTDMGCSYEELWNTALLAWMISYMEPEHFDKMILTYEEELQETFEFEKIKRLAEENPHDKARQTDLTMLSAYIARDKWVLQTLVDLRRDYYPYGDKYIVIYKVMEDGTYYIVTSPSPIESLFAEQQESDDEYAD